MLLKAQKLRDEDLEYANARLAWMISRVDDTDKDGKRVYRKFKDFYDPDKRMKVLEKGRPPAQYRHLAVLGRKLNGGGE